VAHLHGYTSHWLTESRFLAQLLAQSVTVVIECVHGTPSHALQSWQSGPGPRAGQGRQTELLDGGGGAHHCAVPGRQGRESSDGQASAAECGIHREQRSREFNRNTHKQRGSSKRPVVGQSFARNGRPEIHVMPLEGSGPPSLPYGPTMPPPFYLVEQQRETRLTLE
jgi:hypothetical protein